MSGRGSQGEMKGQGELEDGEWRPPPISLPEDDSGQPWKEVIYRKRSVPISSRRRYEYRKDVVVFFVGNIPDGCTTPRLKDVFKVYGRLTDVYMPGRRDRRGKGNLFAFVKYAGVQDCRRLEEILNSVTIDGAKLGVNIAKFDRNKQPIVHQKPIDVKTHFVPPKVWVQKNQSNSGNMWVAGGSGLSFKDKLINSSSTMSNVPIVNMDDIPGHMVVRLGDFTVIGKVKNFDVLDNFITDLDGKLGNALSVRYVGGMRLMISFLNNEDAKDYCEDKTKWGKWFHSMVLWTEGYKEFERVARIKIYGVPLAIWTAETFEKIASRYGKIVHFDGIDWTNSNFAYCELDILVKSGARIKESMLLEKGNDRFMVWISETDFDWRPSCLDKNFRMATYESEFCDKCKSSGPNMVEVQLENLSSTNDVRDMPENNRQSQAVGVQVDNNIIAGQSLEECVVTLPKESVVPPEDSVRVMPPEELEGRMGKENEKAAASETTAINSENNLNMGGSPVVPTQNRDWAPGLLGLTPSFGPFSSRKRPRFVRSPSDSPNPINLMSEFSRADHVEDLQNSALPAGTLIDASPNVIGVAGSDQAMPDVVEEAPPPVIGSEVLKEIEETVDIGECIGIKAAPFRNRIQGIINGEETVVSR
ncbi:hypothetical protein SSX86_029132 [Deinandra increscens subsp. villosa]|uniref:RRM domain-containing protein n=1 Tax=Deinandra increscens subsp. villosa TaxID=3103831 RepID=A0AAP0CC09_9ASTR